MRDSAFKGLPFPYVALCPSTRKKAEFRSISDVYDEIIRLSDEAEQKGFAVGDATYQQIFYFADHSLLINEDYQDRIKEYTFCKKFSCPPYPSLQETPPIIIDDFLIIEEEYSHCIAKAQKENKDA